MDASLWWLSTPHPGTTMPSGASTPSPEVYEADWHEHGRAAGPIRNARMIAEGRPDLVIAFPGGRGTADMVSRARKAGIEVREVSA